MKFGVNVLLYSSLIISFFNNTSKLIDSDIFLHIYNGSFNDILIGSGWYNLIKNEPSLFPTTSSSKSNNPSLSNSMFNIRETILFPKLIYNNWLISYSLDIPYNLIQSLIVQLSKIGFILISFLDFAISVI